MTLLKPADVCERILKFLNEVSDDKMFRGFYYVIENAFPVLGEYELGWLYSKLNLFKLTNIVGDGGYFLLLAYSIMIFF